MKRFKMIWILTLGTILVMPSLSLLKAFSEVEACPEIVREALTTSKDLCDQTGRNQACYGHLSLEAQPQPDIEDFVFDEEGDVVDLVDLQGMRLEGMDVEEGIWGVAMLRLQANLPETEPKENVTVLLFGDVQIENRVDEEIMDEYSPMQAFYFRSSADDSVCTEAPESGMLIQTPEGVAEVSLLINEVNVELGSTVFFQTEADGKLTVSVVEGKAHVEGMGEISTAFAGTQLSIPLDANLKASGPPSKPEPYKIEKFEPMPLDLLEREVTVHPPLSQSEIDEKQEEEAKATSTRTPRPTDIPSRTSTLPPTDTDTPSPTSTFPPTDTYTPLPTFTFPPTDTYTPLPTFTFPPTATDTPLPTDPPSPTSTEELSTEEATEPPTDSPLYPTRITPDGDNPSVEPLFPTATEYWFTGPAATVTETATSTMEYVSVETLPSPVTP